MAVVKFIKNNCNLYINKSRNPEYKVPNNKNPDYVDSKTF